MYFKTEGKSKMQVSYVSHVYNLICIFVVNHVYNIRFYHIPSTFGYDLFVCHSVPLREASEGISLCLCQLFCLFACLF